MPCINLSEYWTSMPNQVVFNGVPTAKTKAILLTNHKGRSQSQEPIKTQTKCM